MKKQFETYFKALQNHDIETVIRFLSGDFKLHFSGSEFSIDRNGMRDVLGWDKGVGGAVSYENLVVEGHTVSALFTERNDFFRLIGIEELKAENSYTFDGSGLIVKQVYTLLPGQPSFVEKMQPAVEWARKTRPEELNEIYPGNRIRYNREMGERWVKLLEEWKEAAGAG